MRYNTGVLPGAKDRIFVFGHSGGGAQSSVMGASGDAEAYTPYLTSLGAAMTDASGKTIAPADPSKRATGGTAHLVWSGGHRLVVKLEGLTPIAS